MQQVHTATARRLSRATSAHSEDERARDDRRRYGSCRRARRPGALRKLSARETTGGHTEAVVARKAALGPARSETSGASYRTSGDQRGTSGDQRRARPVARATGRAEYQPVRATSALKKEPRVASTRRADTSQRGARPVARATGRAEYQPVRVTSALKKGPRAASTGRADTSQRGARPVARAAGRARS